MPADRTAPLHSKVMGLIALGLALGTLLDYLARHLGADVLACLAR